MGENGAPKPFGIAPYPIGGRQVQYRQSIPAPVDRTSAKQTPLDIVSKNKPSTSINNKPSLRIKAGRSFDSQAKCVIDVFGLFSWHLSMAFHTTMHWQTSGRLVQKLNVFTVCTHGICHQGPIIIQSQFISTKRLLSTYKGISASLKEGH